MNTTFIIHFRNYDTFLCVFNYKIISNTTELVIVRDSPLDVFSRA